MKYYCLHKLCSGADVNSACYSLGRDHRRHLWSCLAFEDGRLTDSPHTDKGTADWCRWAQLHDYFGFGIPKTLPEQEDGVRLVAENPFEGCNRFTPVSIVQ